MSEGRKTKIVLLDERHLEILVQVGDIFLFFWVVICIFYFTSIAL